MENSAELITKAASRFYHETKADPNSRYRSWEHCYKSFHDARRQASPDPDYLSLQLAFYLASWGMYRGSSFLLQKDYKVHVPVVEEILKKEYDCLLGLSCMDLRKQEVQDALASIETFLENYFDALRREVRQDVKNKVSTTLITKTLLGTFGCVPAYDRYFVEGIKDQKVAAGTYGMKSLLQLADFYERNEEHLEKTRRELMVYDLSYPQMKLLDMGFWRIGFDKELRGREKR